MFIPTFCTFEVQKIFRRGSISNLNSVWSPELSRMRKEREKVWKVYKDNCQTVPLPSSIRFNMGDRDICHLQRPPS
jgi:hypothetical protein